MDDCPFFSARGIFKGYKFKKNISLIRKMKSLKLNNPLLRGTVLRETTRDWSLTKIRKRVSKKILKDALSEHRFKCLLKKFTSIEEFCSNRGYRFIIKTQDGQIKKFSSGPEIIIDESTSRLCFDLSELYWVPKCIDKRLTTVIEIFSNAGLSLTEEDIVYYGENKLKYDDIITLERNYKVCFRIWSKTQKPHCHGYKYFLFSKGCEEYQKEIFMHYQEESETFFLIQNQDKYFAQYFPCKNRPSGCFFTFRTKKLKEEHELLCGSEKLQILQREFGPSHKLIEKAENNGVIPKLNFNRDFIFFDIESTLPKSDIQTAKTQVLSTHEIVSIAANRKFINLDSFFRKNICYR